MMPIHEQMKPPVDVLPFIDKVSEAHASHEQPAALFRALDNALACVLGHTLFTILSYDRRICESTRLYSNLPERYPAGERKALVLGPWTDSVLVRGEAYICRTSEDLRAVFSDHELIDIVGCQSALNVPIRWRGVTYGSINLLHKEHWYDASAVAVALPFAQLTLPALLAFADS
jgi:hypothetical protein